MSLTNLRIRVIAAFAATAVGCTVGNDFVRPDDDALVVGATTLGEAAPFVRVPHDRGFVVINGIVVEVLTFLYVEPSAEGTLPGVSALRLMDLVFSEDVLVARRFYSSFKKDGTPRFDPALESAVTHGMAEQEVVRLLGQPTGEYRYPVIADRAGRALVYGYTQTPESVEHRNVLNFFAVELDDRNQVRATSVADGRALVHRYPTAAQAEEAEEKARQFESGWPRLTKGMSRSQVYDLLGPVACSGGLLTLSDVGLGPATGSVVVAGAPGCALEFTDGALSTWALEPTPGYPSHF